MHWRMAKNAVANLGRGGTAALVALLLPPILVRHMPAASYAVWVLVLQTAAYVTYLNFGLQTAIGRYVAFANERRDPEQRDSVFSTAFVGLCLAALLALLGLAAVAVAVPAIFPSVPAGLVLPMRIALLIVGLSLALDLPASACNGVFLGLERYELPAFTVGGGRVLSGMGIVAAALSGCSLVTMALVVGASNLLAQLAQVILLHRVAPEVRFQPALVRRATAHELYEYCLGLTVMAFAMLLISGLDLLLVGRFDFARVIPYSVSATLVLFIGGVLAAGVQAMLPYATVLHARQQHAELGRLTVNATRIAVLVLVLTGLPILVFAHPILRLWIGPRFVAPGVPLLFVLVLANILRLIGLPYATALVAAGQQSYVKVSPLTEGIANFVASVILGSLYGAIGVAMGTLFGSVISIGSHLFYSMPRTRHVIALSRRELILSGVLRPLLVTLPLSAAAAAACMGFALPLWMALASIALSAAGAAWLLLRGGASPLAMLRQIRAGYTEADATDADTMLRNSAELERLEGHD